MVEIKSNKGQCEIIAKGTTKEILVDLTFACMQLLNKIDIEEREVAKNLFCDGIDEFIRPKKETLKSLLEKLKKGV